FLKGNRRHALHSTESSEDVAAARLAIETNGALLAVEFVRHGDRLAHRILLDGVVALESIEGAADEDWPPSPPLQESHRHAAGAQGDVLMLVGKAGKGHWSMTVAADAAHSALVFDVACRLRGAPRFLGSTYQQAASGAALPLQIVGQSAVAEQTSSDLVITPVDEPPLPAQPQSSDATTTRWTYRIAVGRHE
ncbi:MAG: hypothetical protein KDA41_16775, partial [Planctomycetales bacterium]|nr:hypothetical protein [Planctomycetales bacterium]